MQQGVAFFSLMRNLTASGFYTTEMGYKDVGYVGNRANQWNGVPDDVLKQYGMSYSEKELKECISFDKVWAMRGKFIRFKEKILKNNFGKYTLGSFVYESFE